MTQGGGRVGWARLRRRFPDIDLVVFGHSHIPLQAVDGDFGSSTPAHPPKNGASLTEPLVQSTTVPRGCTLNVAGEQRQDRHQEQRHTDSVCHELPARHGLRILTFATCELAQNRAYGSIPTLRSSEPEHNLPARRLKCRLRLPIWEFRENLETHGHHEVCWRSLLPAASFMEPRCGDIGRGNPGGLPCY
jgi:hypothetical protein